MSVAAIQMVSSDQLAENLAVVEKRVVDAVTRGAKLLVLPENFALMASKYKQLLSIAEPLGVGPIQDFLSKLSRRHACWIVAGSMPIRTADKK